MGTRAALAALLLGAAATASAQDGAGDVYVPEVAGTPEATDAADAQPEPESPRPEPAAPMAAVQAPPPDPPREPADDAPPPAPPPPAYAPTLDFDSGGTKITLPLSAALRAELLNAFPVAEDGTRLEPGVALDGRVRVGLRWSSERELVPARLVLTFEADTPTGRLFGGPDSVGPFTPEDDGDDGFENESDDLELEIRQAFLQLDIGYHIHVLGGIMTSHWGMGLLANDGAHGWTPGSALFTDPRGGDRVLRAGLVVGPFTDHRVAFIVASDWVVDEPLFMDDDATLEGDEAQQLVGSVVWGFREPQNLGIYAVARTQEALDGDEADIRVVDIAGARTIDLGAGAVWTLEGEAAYLWGETELGPSLDFPRHDIEQFGAAGRSTFDLGTWGTALDVLFTSGDENFDDGALNGFRADVNYPLGLIAHRHVLAAQSARAVVTAGDPALVGFPAEDLDRVPTRQQITNTFAVFPRGMVRPMPQLEIFAGPLFLFAPEDVIDPFHTRIAGGDGRNAFNGKPGKYIGTEADLGLRYRRMFATTEFVLGLEGGLFLPGNAFNDAAGNAPDPVGAGRFTTEYRF